MCVIRVLTREIVLTTMKNMQTMQPLFYGWNELRCVADSKVKGRINATGRINAGNVGQSFAHKRIGGWSRKEMRRILVGGLG